MCVHDLYLLFKGTNAEGALALREVDDVGRYGVIELSSSHVVRFQEKCCSGCGLVNGGTYIFTKRVANYVDRSPYSIEHDLIPRLIRTHSLVGRPYRGFFIDIGTPESLAHAQEHVPKWWEKISHF